jgi:hypothetical protein
MTVDSAKPDRLKWLGSNLMLGFLVTVLSIFTAVANYSTYVVGGKASDYQAEGDRLLANSNTEYIRATQFIIVDYTMYDRYYVNLDKDNAAADYYQANFSDELKASLDRNDAFDSAYSDAMYADADATFDEAFAKIDQSNAESGREAGYQLAMLITAVGLAFAAYASLLDEANRLRRVFALMSLIMLVLSLSMFFVTSAA